MKTQLPRGKSHIAKAIAKKLGIKLIKIDLLRLYEESIRDSEKIMRKALKIIK